MVTYRPASVDKVTKPITRIFSYNPGSAGSSDLAKAMGIKRIKFEGSTFVGGPGKTVINWGASKIANDFIREGTRVLNYPTYVSVVTDKLKAFKALAGNCRMPAWSQHPEDAQGWLNKGFTVFARTVLNGHSGNGIRILDPEHPEDWAFNAPLYVRYVKKREEYRVHICKDRDGQLTVIDVQRKGLRRELDPNLADHRVRNLANGFVFVRNEIQVPEEVYVQALAALNTSMLDFGAVDVIWNEKEQQAYVLEINTAPGLQGQTIESYATALSAITK